MNADERGFRFETILLFLICVYLRPSAAISSPPEPEFEPQTIDDAISIGYGVDVGEVDGDGHPDILLADAKQIVWYKNPGKPGEKWPKFVMAENLTPLDNVCLAARDINGDGKVEVAVGAQWNPGETTDPEKSGAIFYLIRPEDPTQKWEPVQIKPHDPTVHRMRWVRVSDVAYRLAVLPLHGVGNKNGQGKVVRMQILAPPAEARDEWKSHFIETGLHMTHNFDFTGTDATSLEGAIVAGAEGIWGHGQVDPSALPPEFRELFDHSLMMLSRDSHPAFQGAGEVRTGHEIDGRPEYIATIEPMHGNAVAAYILERGEDRAAFRRMILDDGLSEGHALACADFLKLKREQLIAGWRQPNAEKKVGIRMYVPQDEKYETWKTYTIDDNTMACEDLKVHDLDGDGRPDIVASGRATKNVIVYWNRTPKAD